MQEKILDSYLGHIQHIGKMLCLPTLKWFNAHWNLYLVMYRQYVYRKYCMWYWGERQEREGQIKEGGKDRGKGKGKEEKKEEQQQQQQLNVNLGEGYRDLYYTFLRSEILKIKYERLTVIKILEHNECFPAFFSLGTTIKLFLLQGLHYFSHD